MDQPLLMFSLVIKLVLTIVKNDSDYSTNINETLNSNYTEGVFLDYRHFDKYDITPRLNTKRRSNAFERV